LLFPLFIILLYVPVGFTGVGFYFLFFMGVVVDLKDFGVRTPGQVVRIFYEMYGSAGVKEELLQVFALLAVSERKGIPAMEGCEEQVIRLFDQLVFLVEAIEKLRLGMGVGVRCEICGTERTMQDKRA
jgi:hypothetical protein